MSSGCSTARPRVVLVAGFASLHDAAAAARFLNERGVLADTIGVRSATQCSDGGRPRSRSRPLIYAAFGGVATGLVGSLLWTVVASDVLTAAWRVVATVFVGASAGGSIGVLTDQGLDVRFGERSGTVPWAGEDHAVVAVEASQVRDATELLRRIGVDRILVAEDRHF